EDDHVWLADFGLARPVHAEALTSQGVGVGTFDYMAPEQRRAGEVGPPADVYALGLVLYETLAGHVPDVVDRDPPPPLQLPPPAVANALHDVCARALARAPQDRFPSAGALIEVARAALTGPDMAYIAPTAPERRHRRWLT